MHGGKVSRRWAAYVRVSKHKSNAELMFNIQEAKLALEFLQRQKPNHSLYRMDLFRFPTIKTEPRKQQMPLNTPVKTAKCSLWTFFIATKNS